jgi:hypothetical protein
MNIIRKLTNISLIIPIILLWWAYEFDLPLIGTNKSLDKILSFIVAQFAASLFTMISYLIYLLIKKLPFKEISGIDRVKLIFSLVFSLICFLGWGLMFIVASN